MQLDDSERDYHAVEVAKLVIQKIAWMRPDSVVNVESFQITDDRSQELVARVLHEVKNDWKMLEEERKKITKPLLEAKQKTDALFKPALDTLARVEALLKRKITEYLDTKSAANTAALQVAAIAPTPAAASQVLATVKPVSPPQGVSVRQVWRFEVTDPELVPREFCSPDPKKIGSVDPTRIQIPGVRFFQEAVVTARSR